MSENGVSLGGSTQNRGAVRALVLAGAMVLSLVAMAAVAPAAATDDGVAQAASPSEIADDTDALSEAEEREDNEAIRSTPTGELADDIDETTVASTDQVSVDPTLANATGKTELVISLTGGIGDIAALESVDRESAGEVLADQVKDAQQPVVTSLDTLEGTEVNTQFWLGNILTATVDLDETSLKELTQIDGIETVSRNVDVELPSEPTPTLTLTDDPTAEAEGHSADEVEDDHTVDPAQTDLPEDYTYGLQQIDLPNYLNKFDAQGEGTKVAILDNGLDPDHPDLDVAQGVLVENGETNGSVADLEPADGHGDHVSGTAVGTAEPFDGDVPRYSVAPEAELLKADVFAGDATLEDVVAGVEWGVENDADVVSMSLGFSPVGGQSVIAGVMEDVIGDANDLGTVIVGSAGNEGVGDAGGPATSPGAEFSSLSIGASDENRQIAPFSSGDVITPFSAHVESSTGEFPEHYPSEYIKPDISAPGVSIVSAQPVSTYALRSGTSMAAPHVAGAVALIQSATDDNLDPAVIEAALQETAEKPDDLPPRDIRYGTGIINVTAATQVAADHATIEGTVTESETDEPIVGEAVRTDTGQVVSTGEDSAYSVHVAPDAGMIDVTADGFGFESETHYVSTEGINETDTALLGDVTMTGEVTIDDVIAIYRVSIGLDPGIDDFNGALADVTGDGTVTFDDAIVAHRISLGLEADREVNSIDAPLTFELDRVGDVTVVDDAPVFAEIDGLYPITFEQANFEELTIDLAEGSDVDEADLTFFLGQYEEEFDPGESVEIDEDGAVDVLVDISQSGPVAGDQIRLEHTFSGEFGETVVETRKTELDTDIEPAEFEISDLQPDEVLPITENGVIQPSAVVENVGQETGIREIDLFVEDDETEARVEQLDEIELAPLENQVVSADVSGLEDIFDLGDAVTYGYEVVEDRQFGGLLPIVEDSVVTDTTLVRAETETFVIEEVDAPLGAGPGEEIDVHAEIRNVGEFGGEQEVEYRLDDELIASQEVTIESTETETVTFEDVEMLDADGLFAHSVSTDDDAAESDIVFGTGTITGTVTDNLTGDAVEGVTLEAEGTSGLVIERETDEDGTYTFGNLAADIYSINVVDVPDGYFPEAVVEVGENETVERDFTIPPLDPVVTGTVEETIDGTPVDNITVFDGDQPGTDPAEGEFGPFTTDEDGQFEFDAFDVGLERGQTITLRATGDGFEDSDLTAVDIGPGENVADIELTPQTNLRFEDQAPTIRSSAEGSVYVYVTSHDAARVEIEDVDTGFIVGETTVEAGFDESAQVYLDSVEAGEYEARLTTEDGEVITSDTAEIFYPRYEVVSLDAPDVATGDETIEVTASVQNNLGISALFEVDFRLAEAGEPLDEGSIVEEDTTLTGSEEVDEITFEVDLAEYGAEVGDHFTYGAFTSDDNRTADLEIIDADPNVAFDDQALGVDADRNEAVMAENVTAEAGHSLVVTDNSSDLNEVGHVEITEHVFDENIPVPVNATPGEYTVHLTTDRDQIAPPGDDNGGSIVVDDATIYDADMNITDQVFDGSTDEISVKSSDLQPAAASDYVVAIREGSSTGDITGTSGTLTGQEENFTVGVEEMNTTTAVVGQLHFADEQATDNLGEQIMQVDGDSFEPIISETRVEIETGDATDESSAHIASTSPVSAIAG